jgi:hypothetical protein
MIADCAASGEEQTSSSIYGLFARIQSVGAYGIGHGKVE